MPEMNSFSRFFVNLFGSWNSRRRFRWVQTVIRLPADASCLEIGCGNGDLAARIVDAFTPAHYTATDIDPHQIETAQRHLSSLYHHRVPASLELRTADMLALPFPDSAFDAVFAFVVLHHASSEHHDFTHVPRALGEVSRVLRPGGCLVYEEFLHREAIREWLTARGYTLKVVESRRNHERVVAIKASLENRPPSQGVQVGFS
jgi:ubiquinone/menaquinone biosynthesis C-methylase UbiE